MLRVSLHSIRCIQTSAQQVGSEVKVALVQRRQSRFEGIKWQRI